MKQFYTSLLIVGLILTIGISAQVSTQIPRTFTVQGILTDNTSTPIPDGIHQLTVRIYEKQTGGDILYAEEYSIPLTKGLFNLTLGAKAPLPSSLTFDRQYFVGISYDGKQEMSRIPLSSVPYSIMSATVPDGAITTTKIADGSITADKLSPALHTELKADKTLSNTVASTNFVGGGDLNTASGAGNYNAIVAGKSNTVSAQYAAIGGGFSNSAAAANSTISGGNNNSTTSSATYSAVSGGINNNATGISSTISGGSTNSASGQSSTVGGGISNSASAQNSTVNGGTTNNASGTSSAIGGGSTNSTSASYSTVGGGYSNAIGSAASYSTIAGGNDNSVSAIDAAIGGGNLNSITSNGTYSFIGGGRSNSIGSTYSAILGGYSNFVNGSYSTIIGGNDNAAYGDYSVVLGGNGLSLGADADRSFGYLANTGSSHSMNINTPNVAVFGNTDLWLASNDGTTRALKLFSNNLNTSGTYPGTTAKNIAIKAPNGLVNDYTITLPSDAGSAGQSLTTDGNGVLSWAGIGGASGSAGGDLTGTYPNPQIAAGAVTLPKLSSTGASAGQIITYNGSNIVWGNNPENWNVGGNASPTSTLFGNNAANGNLNLRAGNQTRMSINGTTGFIGINKAVPDQPLDIYRSVDPAGSGFLDPFYGLKVIEDVSPTISASTDYRTAQFALNFKNSNRNINYAGVSSSSSVSTAADYSGTVNYAAGMTGGVFHNGGTITEAHGSVSSINLSNGATVQSSGVSYASITNNGGTFSTTDLFAATVGNYGFNAPANINSVKMVHLYAPDNFDFSSFGGYTATISSLYGIKIEDFSAISPAPTTVHAINYADKFIVSANGNLDKIKNVSYDFPASNATGALLNNGSGTLFWGDPTPGGTAGGDLSGTYPNPQIAAGTIVNADINSSAAIDYSKVNLTGNIVNADVSNSAAIAYSKLDLNNSIVAGDITSDAVTTGKIENNAVNGAKIALGSDAAGDIMYYDGTDYVRLPVGSPAQVLTVDGSNLPSWASAPGLTNFTESVNTSAPNGSTPVAQLLATNAASDVDIALTPKGTGALTAQVADNTATGGNKRGTYSVDWQMVRSANTQIALAPYSTLSGGSQNTSNGYYAVVGGGYQNTVNADYGSIGGGYGNTVSNQRGTIAGGVSNTISGDDGYIGGGQSNTASGSYAIVSGGEGNTASAAHATIGGGKTNVASLDYATVAGGESNTASKVQSTVGGGFFNTASGERSTVSGGIINTASGDYSAIVGGRGLTLSGIGSVGYLNNAGGTNDMTVSENGTAVLGNVDMWLVNNDNTAHELRIYEASGSGSDYTAFKAQPQSSAVTYTLPDNYPATNGEVLSSTTGGGMSWAKRKVTIAAYDPADVAAGTFADIVIGSVTGLVATDAVNVSRVGGFGDLIVASVYVSNTDELTIRVYNPTGAGVDLGAADLYVGINR